MSYLTGGLQSQLQQTQQSMPLFYDDANMNQTFIQNREIKIDTSNAPKLQTRYFHSLAGKGFVKNTHPIQKNYSYINANYPQYQKNL